MFDPKPYFFTISFDDCQNLQWRLGLVSVPNQHHYNWDADSREVLNTERHVIETR
jgi:hypothetical protein